MNNVAYQVLLIASIFIVAVALCFTQNVLVGFVFLLTANMLLPSVISLGFRSVKRVDGSQVPRKF